MADRRELTLAHAERLVINLVVICVMGDVSGSTTHRALPMGTAPAGTVRQTYAARSAAARRQPRSRIVLHRA